jgi:tripartite-type tricarboxylate transporter receptor subunit TctC
MKPAALALGLVAAASAACGAQADSFYNDKTITLVIGFSPGGGYDTYARAVARHMPQHIDGSPNMIVQNMPGAGSLTAVRALNSTLPTDGTTMLTFNPGLITQSVVDPARVGVRFTDYKWVGIITPDFRVCYGYGPNGVKSWDDLKSRKKFVLGATGKGSGSYVNGAILRIVFDLPVQQVIGFPGSADQRLAIERGELDGDCGSFSSIPVDWIKNDLAHPFVRFTKDKQPGMPDAARFIEEFATPEQKTLLDVLDGEDEIGRSIIASGHTPPDRLEILRKAFDATMQDPAFQEEMKRLDLPLDPVPGAQVDKIVANMLNVPASVQAKAKEIYQ